MGLFSFFKKPKPSGDERRHHRRWNRVFIAQCDAADRKSYSTVFNISRSGLGVYLESSLPEGSEIQIVLQHAFKDGAYSSDSINLSLPVKVIWIKEIHPDEKEFPGLEEKKFRAGLELLPMPADLQARFDDLMRKVEGGEDQSSS